MSLILAKNISEFKNFFDIDSKLMIYERNAPQGSASFFKNLIKITHVCEIFCDIQNTSSISMWIGSKRGCKRFHIDNVPQRLLVTYSGEGTEWLPDAAADKSAYLNGEPNEKILKFPQKKQFVNEWDIAIFKGGSEGLLHRTPDSALKKNSILLRLDHADYWKNIYNNIL